MEASMTPKEAARYLGSLGGKATAAKPLTARQLAARRANIARGREIRLQRLADAARVAALAGGRP